MTSTASGSTPRMLARSSRSLGWAAAGWAAMYSSTVANGCIGGLPSGTAELGDPTKPRQDVAQEQFEPGRVGEVEEAELHVLHAQRGKRFELARHVIGGATYRRQVRPVAEWQVGQRRVGRPRQADRRVIRRHDR